jgi:hypothetical protein
MNINEPIRLDDSILSCEIGNRLALEVLDAVRYAVLHAGRESYPALRREIVSALLDDLHSHTADCVHCGNEWEHPGARPRMVS